MSHLTYARRRFGPVGSAALPAAARLPLPSPGRIVAVIGASGAGKTRALDALALQTGARPCRSLTRQQLARPVLSLFPAHLDSPSVMRALAACGLADATMWARKACTLSAGEQRRLELALVLGCRRRGDAARAVILDEFDAHLDAETSLALAASLAQLARRHNIRLIVSTHRPECLGALNVERVISIEDHHARELPPPPAQDLLAEVMIERGRLADYAAFSRWHYLGAHRPGPVSDVFVARFRTRIVAVATFGPTHLFLSPRNLVLPQFSSRSVSAGGARALNASVRLLSRVVVEPRFRALGVASRLLASALPQLGVPFVECLAEMGEFSGFLERAGFARSGRCKPSREAARLCQTLERLGLDARALADARSRARVLAQLSRKERAGLQRKLKGLCRSRIETGQGSLRGLALTPEATLARALGRLHCRPEYFLWSRDEPA